MPKVKPLIRQDPREIDMMRQIGGAAEAAGKSYRVLCERAGISYETFMQHKKNIKKMKFGEFWAFMDACDKLIGG